MRDLTEPVTRRGRRVFAILTAARDGLDLASLRREHADLWPAGDAGDRKWSRDRKDALDCRVYGPGDEVSARRVRLLDWLDEHGPATTREIEAALGYARSYVAWTDLVAVGAVHRTVRRPRGIGRGINLWAVEAANLAPARARRAA